MDERRKALEEQREALHLELLMDDYAAQLGTQAEKEAREAYEKGEFTVPPELDAAVLEMIDAAPEPKREPRPVKMALRYALVAALTVAVLVGTLIAVQAAGIDVFGRVASWSDSVFHFEREAQETAVREAPTGEAVPSENRIQAILRENGFPMELAPTWLPEGYEITEIGIDYAESSTSISVLAEAADKVPITIWIFSEGSSGIIDYTLWEKNGTKVVMYYSNGRTFYLMENNKGWAGAWADDKHMVSFSGVETIEQIKNMIDSMGAIN